MSDADYAGAPLDAVTFGEVHYVAVVKGQAQDIIFMVETGWSNRLFLLSQDDNQVQKISTPDNLSCPPHILRRKASVKNTNEKDHYKCIAL